jgi:hypothetical protein
MKTKLLFLVVLMAATIFSCQKKDNTVQQQEVVFTAIQIDPGAGLKGTADWDWECTDGLQPVYAKITIGTKDYTPLVFRLDGKLYTQAIKLDPGTYTVSNFLIMDDMGDGMDDGGTGDNDQIYMATPAGPPAAFSQYTDPNVPFDITVTAFTKLEVPVEVLCFIPDVWEEFGFDWFVITEIIVREQCFFGDICLKHWDEYAGSHYDLQPGPLQLDMVAIMTVKVYKQDAFGVYQLVEEFTNDVAPDYGVGDPLCVQYADVLGVTDHFKFELYILVKQGNLFLPVLFKTWLFDDIDNIDDGDDGVVDFVLGNCNFSGNTGDYVFAPWQNLPASTNVNFAYVGNIPGNNQYWDVTFNSYTPAGSYDLPAPVVTMDGWCGDLGTVITPGTYNALVFSSLNSANWIGTMPVTLAEMAQVNWLMNHLGDYGINIGDDTGLDGGVVQQAIWNILNGASYGPPASTMSADAALHPDFVPLPGGWAAVLLVAENPANPGVYVYQLIFVIVDP